MDISYTNKAVLSASAFDRSIAVNAHSGYGSGSYNDASLMIDDLRYLGISTIRDSFATDPSAVPVMNALAAAGYKFDFVVPSNLPVQGSTGLQQYITSIHAFLVKHPGSVAALEGLNEVNIQAFSYNGSSSLAAAALFQKALYSVVNADTLLKNIPVYNLTIGLNSSAASASLGNLAASADYANAHAYVATSTPESYGLRVSLGLAEANAIGKPTVITESGYTTLTSTPGLGVDRTVQAKSILNSLVEAFNAGVSKSYLYQLLDINSSSSDTNPEDHFGLFNSDGTPKLVARAIHNLTSILADDGTGGQLPKASLSYQLMNLPGTGNSMVLDKTNGAYDLVIWAEPKTWNDATNSEIANPTNRVSVHLDRVHQSVKVYDPLNGTTPIASYTNVQDFKIPVSDHPIIVEIDGKSSVASAMPTHITATAANIVAELSTLNANSSLTQITLTDTHVLPVASQATMQYIINHYGALLSKIQGGYSFAVTISAPTWSLTTTYDKWGHVLSTENTAYSNGVKTYDIITNADGSTVATNYVNGVKTLVTMDHVVGQSYVKMVEQYDAAGNIIHLTQTRADGTLEYTQVTANGNRIGTIYDAHGVKAQESVIHQQNGSHDIYAYGITGHSYTTEHSVHNSDGVMTLFERLHANGSEALKVTKAADGSSVADQFNASGVLNREIRHNADGSSSVSSFDAGHKTKMFVTHADHSTDSYSYGITGQTYTNQVQHADPTGFVTSVARTHGDGTLDFRETFAKDGSTVSYHYDAKGAETSKVIVSTTGAKDVFTFNFDGEQGATQHVSYNSSGRALMSDLTHHDGSHLITTFSSGLTASGGSQNDHFVLDAGSTAVVFNHGNDQIDSFRAGTANGHDVIEISRSLASNFSQLQIEQKGTDTLIHIASTDDSVLLTHITASAVTHSNFLFV